MSKIVSARPRLPYPPRDGGSVAVECKSGEKAPNPALFYFKERINIPRLYQVHTGTRDYEKAGVRVLPFPTFCKEESMP